MYISNFNPVGRFDSYFVLSYKVNDSNGWSVGAQAKAFIGVYVLTVNVSNVFMSSWCFRDDGLLSNVDNG